MKLQSQVARKIGDKEYVKYWVVLPPSIIKKLKLIAGDLLEVDVKKNKITLEKKDD